MLILATEYARQYNVSVKRVRLFFSLGLLPGEKREGRIYVESTQPIKKRQREQWRERFTVCINAQTEEVVRGLALRRGVPPGVVLREWVEERAKYEVRA